MVDPIVEQLVETIVIDAVSRHRMFTAFDITLEAKLERKANARHRDMKEIIHRMFENGQMPSNYLRCSITVSGANGNPFLYYPDGADISNYKPMDRSNFPDAKQTSPPVASNPIGKRNCVRSRDDHVKTDYRGRLTIPQRHIRAIGGHRNGNVYIYPNFAGWDLSMSCDMRPGVIQHYVIDYSLNVRVCPNVFKKIGKKVDKNTTYTMSNDGNGNILIKAN